MPTVSANTGARVLVTGANGFIAMWIICTLLDQGYTVRGAVRSEGKGRHLKEYFSKYGDKVEWVIIPDISKEGAFDEAVKGIDAIRHTASPLPSSTPDPDGMYHSSIKPDVNGTLSILQSALKYGSQVKRVVITSSVGAIINPVPKPTAIFDETYWADHYVKDVREKGKDNPDIVKYRASKVLAERAAWDFYNRHKGSLGWDLVTLNPPLVIGALLQQVDTPDHLNASMELWWKNISQEQSDEILKTSYGYVDVRDTAAAHVIALQKDAAGGERIIISNAAITWQETRNVIHSLKPDLYLSGILPRGKPDLENTILFTFNADKGKKILGMKYRSLEEVTADTLADCEARGWFKPSSNEQCVV